MEQLIKDMQANVERMLVEFNVEGATGVSHLIGKGGKEEFYGIVIYPAKFQETASHIKTIIEEDYCDTVSSMHGLFTYTITPNNLLTRTNNEVMDEVDVGLERLETEIIYLKTQTAQNMIEIGRRLVAAKEKIPHGGWIRWLEEKVDFSISAANKLMKVYQEFGCSNSYTYTNLQSSKIIALLDMPPENRDDFLQSSNVEDHTVRQLKEEIAKYKHDNDLMTEKQKKAYEEKKRAEEETRRLQSELQHEKSKPAKVETKVVEKVVEKVVDKTDYNTINKLKKLEEDNKRLEESKRVFENAMNT